jgi:hypothetical protein
MSAGIDPIRTRSSNGGQVKLYTLPVCAPGKIVSFEKKEQSFASEWRTWCDREQFTPAVLDLLPDIDIEAEIVDVTIISPSEGKTERQVNSKASNWDEFGIPEDSEYISIELDEFEIGWEDWGDYNRIVLSVHDHNLEIFELFFSELISEKERIDTVEEATEQVKKILTEK